MWAWLGAARFFSSGERGSEEKPPFQGSVRNDLRKKKRAGKAKNPRHPKFLRKHTPKSRRYLMPA
jgi:hypothetical protein